MTFSIKFNANIDKIIYYFSTKPLDLSFFQVRKDIIIYIFSITLIDYSTGKYNIGICNIKCWQMLQAWQIFTNVNINILSSLHISYFLLTLTEKRGVNQNSPSLVSILFTALNPYCEWNKLEIHIRRNTVGTKRNVCMQLISENCFYGSVALWPDSWIHGLLTGPRVNTTYQRLIHDGPSPCPRPWQVRLDEGTLYCRWTNGWKKQ